LAAGEKRSSPLGDYDHIQYSGQFGEKPVGLSNHPLDPVSTHRVSDSLGHGDADTAVFFLSGHPLHDKVSGVDMGTVFPDLKKLGPF